MNWGTWLKSGAKNPTGESPTTIYNGDRPETQGGTDILDCVLYVVQTVKETKAKAC